MATLMHIDKKRHLFGGMTTQCGAYLWPWEGAKRNAKMCSACMRKAGWANDRRK